MPYIELVIKMPEELKEALDNAKKENAINYMRVYNDTIYEAIKNGIPLPKGHRDLIDVNRKITVSTYDEQYEEWGKETLTVLEALNKWSDEGVRVKDVVIPADTEGRMMGASDEIIYSKRWIDIYHFGFGYTKCPYCGDETGWYNSGIDRFQSDLKNNQREHCPKCGKRVYAREGWLINQPPIEEGEE